MTQQLANLRAAAEGVVDIEIEMVDEHLSRDELIERCSGCQAIVVGMGVASFDPGVAAGVEGLRLVQTMTAGTDFLDVAGLEAMGLRVENNGGANAPAVAEHAIALMFALHRKLVAQLDSVRGGTWSEGVPGGPDDFRTFAGLHVGIIGLGRIGSRVAKRLAGWECDVVYHDIADFSAEYERETGARRVTLDELLTSSHVVTVHVPLDESTRRLIGEDALKTMRADAILINTSRGAVVDERALVAALESGQIAGCGLDVLEREPVDPENPLLALDNVVITPHFATRARQSELAAAVNAIANIAEVLSA